ncbi:MAG: phosphoribosylamine--glycine ligase [Christensenellales bacterium]|jgi:phosphoribosylamine--glycine ligase
MKVLVVGGGGREHALVWKLAQSPRVSKLYCAPGNGGIGQIAQNVPIASTDVAGVVDFARAEGIDLTFVAQDDPLALGMVDALQAAGLRAFGPNQAAARIESSKVFSKNLMQKYHIPTAKYATFDSVPEAEAYIQAQPEGSLVVKADGLALGKGVIIAQSRAEAVQAVREMMVDHKFKDAGTRVVIEEFLTGPEVTVLAFADGKTVAPMVSSQDHKRALDHDQGLNTGGMGAFAPSPKYTPEIAQVCERTIFQPTIAALAAEGCPFSGVIYFGLMLTPDGPKVIEYNARFGDPEAQAVLPLMENDLMDVIDAVLAGQLDQLKLRFKPGAALCLVLASGGYPVSYQTGFPIAGLEEADAQPDTVVFHAGTKVQEGRIVTAGGRVLGVTALADSLPAAMDKAYAAASHIHFENMHFRTDIGKK